MSQSQEDPFLPSDCRPCAERARSEGPQPISDLQGAEVSLPQVPAGSDLPDSTPIEEGQGAEGPRSRCGPRIGYVALAGEDFEKVQAFVDRGGNPWRLNPVETARVVGSAKLGFDRTDRFWLRGTYIDAGSGLHHALVWATHRTCVYLIELYQPMKQGKVGIWAVERVNEMEQGSIRL